MRMSGGFSPNADRAGPKHNDSTTEVATDHDDIHLCTDSLCDEPNIDNQVADLDDSAHRTLFRSVPGPHNSMVLQDKDLPPRALDISSHTVESVGQVLDNLTHISSANHGLTEIPSFKMDDDKSISDQCSPKQANNCMQTAATDPESSRKLSEKNSKHCDVDEVNQSSHRQETSIVFSSLLPSSTGRGSLSSVDSDAALGRGSQSSVDSDAAPGRGSQSSVDSDAALGRGSLSSVDSDAAPGRGSLSSVDSDAAPGRGSLSSVDSDAAPGRGSQSSVDSDAALGRGSQSSVDSDAALGRGSQSSVDSDAALGRGSQSSVDSDAAPGRGSQSSVDSDAAPGRGSQSSVDSDAAPGRGSQSSVDSDAAPGRGSQSSVDSDAAPGRGSLSSVDSDAAPGRGSLSSVDSDAAPGRGSQSSVDSDAAPGRGSLSSVDSDEASEESEKRHQSHELEARYVAGALSSDDGPLAIDIVRAGKTKLTSMLSMQDCSAGGVFLDGSVGGMFPALDDSMGSGSDAKMREELVNGFDDDPVVGCPKKRHRRYSRFERFDDDEDGVNSTPTATDDDDETAGVSPKQLVRATSNQPNGSAPSSQPHGDAPSSQPHGDATECKHMLSASEISEDESSFVTLKKIPDAIKHPSANGASTESNIKSEKSSAVQDRSSKTKRDGHKKNNENKSDRNSKKSCAKKRNSIDRIDKANVLMQASTTFSPPKRMEELLGKKKTRSPQVPKARKSLSSSSVDKKKKVQRAKMSLSPNKTTTVTIDSFFKPLDSQGDSKVVSSKTSAQSSNKKSTRHRHSRASDVSISVVDSSTLEHSDSSLSLPETTISSDDASKALSALQTDENLLTSAVMKSEHYMSDGENNSIVSPNSQLSNPIMSPNSQLSNPITSPNSQLSKPIMSPNSQLSRCIKMPKARKSFPRCKDAGSEDDKWARARSGDAMAAAVAANQSLDRQLPPSSSITYKIKDLESVFGINKDIEKLDAKTLDKLMLERALKSKEKSETLKTGWPITRSDTDLESNAHDSSGVDNTPQSSYLSGSVTELDCQVLAPDTNFASLITTQRILTKQRKKKRRSRNTYKLPGHRKPPKKSPSKKLRQKTRDEASELQFDLLDIKPVPEESSQTPDEERENIQTPDEEQENIHTPDEEQENIQTPDEERENIQTPDENITNMSFDSLSDLQPEKSEIVVSMETVQSKPMMRRGKKKPKKKKIPKYIRARLRHMQKRIHQHGIRYDSPDKSAEVYAAADAHQSDFPVLQKLSKKRKRSLTGEDDSLSVFSDVTMVTDITESEISCPSKEAIDKRLVRSLSPVTSVPISKHTLLSDSPASQVFSPEKVSGRSIFKPSPQKRPRLSRGLECLNAVPGALRHHIEGASDADGRKFEDALPCQFHNTPNGLTYPATPPPHTPEEAELPSDSIQPESLDECVIQGSDHRGDYIPNCCCRISPGVLATSLPLPRNHLYCQALDSINGKIMGCCSKVNTPNMVRPSKKVPFMVLCDTHRQRLAMHQCCPGCGQFCTEGKFVQCKKEVTKKGVVVPHYFHIQCQTYKANKCYCPHCAHESHQYQVALKFTGPRSSWASLQVVGRVDESGRGDGGRSARMSGISPPSLLSEQEISAPVELSIAATNRLISSKSLPLGATRTEMEMALSLLDTDRAKKLRQGKINLYKACKVGDVEKTVVALAEGCDPNIRHEEESNQCALHAASWSGYHLIVHLLLQAGANPEAQDNHLATPLMLAAEKGHMNVIQILVKSGALVDAKRADGMTTLHLAAQSGKVDAVRFLLETKKIRVNVKDDGGWTPLIWAAEHSHLDVVHYLLANNTDPNMRDNEGNTALHWAAFSGSTAIVEIFLNANCDLETVNELGDRPLHIAARQNHYECVVLFLARGADSDARNNENETAIGCCLDQTTPTWMALRVNRQLRNLATKTAQPPERLIHRDISCGKELNPMPIVNMVDDENYPTDFLYVAENVETSPLNINRLISSLQSCTCKEKCGSVFCDCSRNSVKCWFEKDGKLVKDFIYTDPPFIFECNKACRCWSTCQNRVVQLGIQCRLQIFRTSGRGWGARTLLDIPRGSFVCEYVGELISDADADSREDDSYLFDLDNKDSDTYCIDARRYGNVARFINHLCQPNLTPVKVFVEHQDLRFPRICFFANRDIKAYEELGFDYGEKFWIIKWKQFTCTCGLPRCRYSKETIHKTLEEYNDRQMEEYQEIDQS